MWSGSDCWAGGSRLHLCISQLTLATDFASYFMEKSEPELSTSRGIIRTGSAVGQKKGVFMKFRVVALAIALSLFGYAVPSTFSQDDSNTPSQGASTDKVKSLPPAVQPADPEKVKHDGGKGDVNAIGNRNVGCNRGLGNWYSVEKQI